IDDMESLAEHWLDQGHRLPGVGCCIGNDAVVNASVDGMSPDRGALDAGGIVVGNSVRVICGRGPPPPNSYEKNDPYYYQRELAVTSNCGAVQTFRARNAA